MKGHANTGSRSRNDDSNDNNNNNENASESQDHTEFVDLVDVDAFRKDREQVRLKWPQSCSDAEKQKIVSDARNEMNQGGIEYICAVCGCKKGKNEFSIGSTNPVIQLLEELGAVEKIENL